MIETEKLNGELNFPLTEQFEGFFEGMNSSSFNVRRMQSVKDHTLFTGLRQCYTVSRCQSDIWSSLQSKKNYKKN